MTEQQKGENDKQLQRGGVMPVGTSRGLGPGCSEGNIKCQFVTSELRREWNMEMKEDLGDSATHATSLNLIHLLSVAHRSGGRPRPSRLRKPGLLLALRPRHSHLELRRTHLSRRPGRERGTSGEFLLYL